MSCATTRCFFENGGGSVDVGSHADWTDIDLVSKPDKTLARIARDEWTRIEHSLDEAGRRLYFGQGYYKIQDSDEARQPDSGEQFLIDIYAVRTTVAPLK